MILVCMVAIGFSSVALAAPSSCVIYMDGTLSSSQYSCDGADLQNLYPATGISAALSKAIPYFVGQGYTFVNCTDGFQTVTNGSGVAYSRCYFIKN
jgi:hypothetical protein